MCECASSDDRWRATVFALFNDIQEARRNRIGGRFGRYSFQPSSRCPARNTIIYTSLEGVHNLNEDLFSQALQSRGLAAILRPKSKNSVAVIRAGSMEPEPKGFLQRAQGMAIKGTGALLLLFIAYTCYHVALGALRAIGVWVGSGILGAAAFFAWRMLKGSKKE
jgi:hypothetical protein